MYKQESNFTDWSHTFKLLPYHIYTIWLFTRSDLKTIVVPSTAFGIVCLLSGSLFTTNPSPLVFDVVKRIPVTAFWAWINLLPFTIDNQRQHDGIKEDTENKAWRPLPSNRLNPQQAKTTMLFFYLLAFLSSLYVGGLWQCIMLVGLGYWYNDRRGADDSCVTRNFINACGYVCFMSGTLQVASSCSFVSFSPLAYRWLLTLGLVIFTTIQSQDMYDQSGDRLRKRWTVPLVLGDTAARWTIAASVGIWSYTCPAFWTLDAKGFAATMILGITVIWRILAKRTVIDDKATFRIYNIWVLSLYLLPIFKVKLRP